MNARISLFFLSLLILLPLPASLAETTRGFLPIKDKQGIDVGHYKASYALLIGVSDYEHLDTLPGVKVDIPLVEKALIDQGFVVETVWNPKDRNELEKAFRNFIFKHDRPDTQRLLFYFAGHGHTRKPKFGAEQAYIVGTGAPDPRQPENLKEFNRHALNLAFIDSLAASNIESKHALFMFDSCFAGSLINQTRGVPAYIKDAIAHPVRQYMTSGSAGQKVSDDSLFRKKFIEALQGKADQDNDGYLLASELGNYIKKEVTNLSRGTQTPQEGVIKIDELDDGDFIFRLKNQEPCCPPPPSVTIPPPPSTTLPPQLGHLQVLVNVSTAKVYLDGAYIGQSSHSSALNKSSLASGQYTVTVQAEGCPKQSKPVSLGNNQWSTLSFQLKCDEGKDYSQDRITGMPFVKVRGDSFRMGDLFNEGDSDEKSIRTVRVSDFWLGKHEVTQGEWLKVMGGSNPSEFQKGDDHPVERVSWEMAQDFIKKLNQLNGLSCSGSFPYKSGCYRLPTEAEWEYACREGGRKVRFGNGSYTADPSQINFDASSAYKKDYSRVGTYRQSTVSVKDLKPNSLGLYHMSGNVWEWVQDKYESDYSKIGTDNPIYTGSGVRRVFRGGSWYIDPEDVRCADRDNDSPPYRGSYLGFRLARTD